MRKRKKASRQLRNEAKNDPDIQARKWMDTNFGSRHKRLEVFRKTIGRKRQREVELTSNIAMSNAKLKGNVSQTQSGA